MNHPTPKNIAEYLDQLRRELRGADPAMIQDALYDAEEHLRAELAENPRQSEAEMLARVTASYGAPDEVAEIYRVKEGEVEHAIRPQRPRPQKSALGKFFGVAADPRSYAALFYMLLALATGIFYFTVVVTGLSMSIGFSILIIGIPFIILFFGIVRVLALVEGRLVEAMLGVRMPRRPAYPAQNQTIWQRIGAMFTDPRTWSTLLYMLLMLPLGVTYFSVAVTGLTTSIALIVAPFAQFFSDGGINFELGPFDTLPMWATPLISVIGIALLFATLHLARGVGHLHAQLARHLLVQSAEK
ncbi:MAG: sensor domain-containing protein [Dokdonella sp.]